MPSIKTEPKEMCNDSLLTAIVNKRRFIISRINSLFEIKSRILIVEVSPMKTHNIRVSGLVTIEDG
jgi:hypothetical protein